MRTLRTGSSAMLTRAGVSALLAVAAVGGATSASFAGTTTAQTVMTLSSTTGPTGGGNYLTVTLPSTATSKFASGFVGVQFQNVTSTTQATATCSTNPATSSQVTLNPAASTDLRVLSTTKISIKVPNLTAGPTGFWLLCTYNQAYASAGSAIPASATVIGKANYITAGAPTVTAIAPATGPASGGQTITITGTAGSFPTTITAQTPLSATFAGVPLTNITPLSSASFSAVTPARPASTATPVLQVTTAGGTSNYSGYTYVNGVSVSPNTVPSGQSVDVDVTGAGFSTLNFQYTTGGNVAGGGAGTDVDATGAHVYLVQGVYHNAKSGAVKATPESAECVNVVVISDGELICTVDATKKVAAGVYTSANLPVGTYTATVVDTGVIAAGASDTTTYQTVLSSGATFTVADF